MLRPITSSRVAPDETQRRLMGNKGSRLSISDDTFVEVVVGAVVVVATSINEKSIAGMVAASRNCP